MRSLIAIATLVLSSTLAGQSFRYLDSLSYQQYLSHNAEGVLSTLHVGRKQGFDTYYWRMREGFAHLWQENPRKALFAFRHALRYNPADTNAQLLIAASYQRAGLWQQLWWWRSRHPAVESTYPAPGLFLSSTGEVGQKWLATDHPYLSNTPFAMVGLRHRIGWRWYQQWTYQHLLVNWSYADDAGIPQKNTVVQHQLGSLSTIWLSPRQWLQWSAQIAQVNIPAQSAAWDGMGQLSWNYQWSGFDLRIGAGVASYQDTMSYQAQIGGSWYPAFSDQWRLTLLVLPQWHRTDLSAGTYAEIAWQQRHTYIALMGGTGHRPRFIDPEGLLLYNYSGRLIHNSRLLVRQQLGKHLQLYGGWTWEQKEDPDAIYQQHTPFFGFTYNF